MWGAPQIIFILYLERIGLDLGLYASGRTLVLPEEDHGIQCAIGAERQKEKIMEHNGQSSKATTSRRSFLRKGMAVAGAGTIGAGLLANGLPAFAQSGAITTGDAAILRFLSALETLETDFWQQYNELGGVQDSEVPGGSGNPTYTAALAVLDEDMAQYIHDNTEDEFTHFTFINAYLVSKGAEPVNLDQFGRYCQLNAFC